MLVADVSFLWSVTVIVAVLAGGVFLVEAVAGQFVDLGRQIFHSRTGCQLTRVIRQGCWPVRWWDRRPPGASFPALDPVGDLAEDAERSLGMRCR